MRKETGRWKSRWKIRDLLADGRCGQAVLDFLTSTDVGRLVPPLAESDAPAQFSRSGWIRTQPSARLADDDTRLTDDVPLGSLTMFRLVRSCGLLTTLGSASLTMLHSARW